MNVFSAVTILCILKLKIKPNHVQWYWMLSSYLLLRMQIQFLYISFMQILCGFSHFLWCYLYQMSIIFYCNMFIHLFIYFLQWVCILWMLFFIRSLMFRNVHCMIFMIFICFLYFLNIIFPVIHVYSCYLILFWQWK